MTNITCEQEAFNEWIEQPIRVNKLWTYGCIMGYKDIGRYILNIDNLTQLSSMFITGLQKIALIAYKNRKLSSDSLDECRSIYNLISLPVILITIDSHDYQLLDNSLTFHKDRVVLVKENAQFVSFFANIPLYYPINEDVDYLELTKTQFSSLFFVFPDEDLVSGNEVFNNDYQSNILRTNTDMSRILTYRVVPEANLEYSDEECIFCNMLSCIVIPNETLGKQHILKCLFDDLCNSITWRLRNSNTRDLASTHKRRGCMLIFNGMMLTCYKNNCESFDPHFINSSGFIEELPFKLPKHPKMQTRKHISVSTFSNMILALILALCMSLLLFLYKFLNLNTSTIE